MLLMDVNVLINATNESAPDHLEFASWLSAVMNSAEPYAVSEFVLSSVVRLMTNGRLFPTSGTTDAALSFVTSVRSRPNCELVQPGPRHWGIFTDLCRKTAARGNTVPDAYLAALAIEHDCEWITADRGFGRFPGLRWRHPLDG
ncbi:Ribonuclease VapC43 [Pirellulimonas nuda]|uniref:Ribonuclease VapC n=1 Tax=Pirellulimonas nuda TaxID=2528009 RepID=A0A518DGK3_9BACT|nr:type II toxin-antitoxin system VapC family toxin [Pirellulimonas nuda]QDU90599.1 Ribonuclease VapC43 [Pirellulimonas nuda]